ncbi:unnamed protein product [Protopolystoma xenopodis]|uniref:Uncharacterized protein n=1 Tax=Protopolystoma xenopodis TaxID=117903 RepID=A0A3S5CCV9_9PLAT|nr:unnamed protein product [Protopolystoma xenopodis]
MIQIDAHTLSREGFYNLVQLCQLLSNLRTIIQAYLDDNPLPESVIRSFPKGRPTSRLSGQQQCRSRKSVRRASPQSSLAVNRQLLKGIDPDSIKEVDVVEQVIEDLLWNSTSTSKTSFESDGLLGEEAKSENDNARLAAGSEGQVVSILSQKPKPLSLKHSTSSDGPTSHRFPSKPKDSNDLHKGRLKRRPGTSGHLRTGERVSNISARRQPLRKATLTSRRLAKTAQKREAKARSFHGKSHRQTPVIYPGDKHLSCESALPTDFFIGFTKALTDLSNTSDTSSSSSERSRQDF